MRMWMIDPSMLCKNHLLGEHGEIHKHRHNFEKGHKIDGRLTPFVAIEPLNMEDRHNKIAIEMFNRGYNHKSPYTQPDLSMYDKSKIDVSVDLDLSIGELRKRCVECSIRIDSKLKILSL